LILFDVSLDNCGEFQTGPHYLSGFLVHLRREMPRVGSELQVQDWARLKRPNESNLGREKKIAMVRDEDAFEYHSSNPPGKISIVPTKPCLTQRDLSLAYTPGVAAPCLAIHREPDLVYKYTAKSNLVAVVPNGTAVLGLGNIGPAAGKPVMEENQSHK
jgi:hypothetical protein